MKRTCGYATPAPTSPWQQTRQGLLCFLALCLLCLPSYHDLAAQTPIVRTLPLPQAMAGQSVQCLLQDKQGNLWIGTKSGLLMHNGAETRTITEADGLLEKDVTALFEDSSATLWIGHRSGKVTLHTAGAYQAFNPPEGTPGKPITTFAQDGAGNIWLGTLDEGVYYYDGKRMHNLNMDDNNLADNNIYAIAVEAGGAVWLGSDGGLMQLTPGKDGAYAVTPISMKNGLPDNIVRDIEIRQNELWVAMQDSGLCKYNLQTKKFDKFAGWSFGSVNSFALTQNRSVWLAASTGAVEYNLATKTFRRFTTQQGLVSNRITQIMEDREGTLWIGTVAGVSHVLGDRFEFMTEAEGLLSKNVLAVFTDSKGNLWVGSDNGLTRFAPGRSGDMQAKYYLRGRGYKGRPYAVQAICEDTKGYIWIGTYGNFAFRLDPATGNLQPFGEAQRINETVIGISVGKNGDIWLSTLGGGIARGRYDGNQVKFDFFTQEKNGLAADYVYQVHTDSKGMIWVATDGGGVSRFDGTTFTNYKKKEGLTSTTVISILEDPAGGIWVLTPEEGVFQFTGSGFRKVRTFPNDMSGTPVAVTLDPKANLIAVGNGRIGRFNVADSTQPPRYYTEDDGLRSFEPNQNAIHRDDKGIIWIGTTHGLVRYDALSQSPRESAPPVTFTRLLVDGEAQPLIQGIEIPYSKNRLNIDFVGINLANPKSLVYRYRMAGDKAWSTPSSTRFAYYSGLLFGSYDFEVQASTNGVDWTTPPATFSFRILTPFLLRWYMLVLYGLLAVGGVIGYVRYSTARVRRQNILLEKKVEERTAELRDAFHEISAKNDQLNVAYKEIEEKNQDITESIQYARRIQQSILPDAEKITQAFPDIMVLYLPKDIVSGDFYWYEQVGSKAYIAAIDCTGHGVPGAFMSVMAYNLLNQTINEHKNATPDQILNNLDMLVQRALKQQKDKEGASRDGMDVAMCCYDRETGKLHYSGAMRPLFYKRGEEILELKGDKFPIGGGQHDNKLFTLQTVDVQKGDIFFIFSDGLVDQFGGDNTRKYTPKRLRAQLLAALGNNGSSLAHVHDFMLNDFNQWRGTNTQLDDVVLIGFKPTR